MKQVQHMTREEFERWLALQECMGYTPTNPKVVENIRKELAKGATLVVTERSQ